MPQRNNILIQAAKQAGEIVRNAIPSEGVIEKDDRANLVTTADLASEKKIMSLIFSHFPDDKILSEETASTVNNGLALDRLWVIDPIDGTNNFRYQRNYSSISIAYVEKGVTKIAGVYNPFRDELFYAEKDNGATLNDKTISVGDQTDITKAYIATENSYDPAGTRHNLELLLRFPSTPWICIKGSIVLSLCELAAGRYDLFMHTASKPWDQAAAFLIVQEAGGVVKGFNGTDITFMSPKVIAGNENLVEQCINVLK